MNDEAWVVVNVTEPLLNVAGTGELKSLPPSSWSPGPMWLSETVTVTGENVVSETEPLPKKPTPKARRTRCPCGGRCTSKRSLNTTALVLEENVPAGTWTTTLAGPMCAVQVPAWAGPTLHTSTTWPGNP